MNYQDSINSSSNDDTILNKWKNGAIFSNLKYLCCAHSSTPQDWIVSHPFYSRHIITNFSSDSNNISCSNNNNELTEYIPDTNEIEGLIAYPNIMTEEKAHQLIHILADLSYLKTSENNQVMLFRNIPKVLQKFLESIWEDKLANDKIWCREPLFDQLFINWYLPGEGIVQHVDLPVFDDGILSLSLGDPCLIYFDPIPEYEGDQPAELILRHLDGLTISGTARYKYTHRIDYCEDELSQDGIIIERGHRVSLTMRRMIDN